MTTASNADKQRERHRATGPLSVALLLCLASLGISSRGLAAVFTQTITLPTPPQKTFATSGGGDGWDVALSSTQVFNVFHHDTVLSVACHNQADASQCWPTLTRTITDGSSNFATSGHPALYLDHSTGKLYVYATRVANDQGGVVCVDTVAAPTTVNPFCGFTALTGAGEASLNPGWGLLSKPMLVGTKLYSFNYVPGFGAGGPSGTTTRNRMLCFDVSTDAACAGQPFAVNLPATGAMTNFAPSPATNAIGTALIIPFYVNGYGATCFDASTQTTCAGAWPIATGTWAGSYGPAVPVLDSTFNPSGFCIPNNSGACYALTGASVPAPPGLTSAITPTTVWNGPAALLGPRVYQANQFLNNEVECYDFSTHASCAGFPKAFAGLGSAYTVNPDPQRPACLWVNADNGPEQIQDFDAYTGGPCSGLRVLAAQFIVPQDKCNPASYVSLQVVDPARSTYTSGTVDFENGAGNPIGIPTETLDSTGTVSLTGLSLNTSTGLPQFLITLSGAPPSLGQVRLTLTWVSNYDPTCVGPGGTVAQQPTTVTTSLSGGGMTGANISVSSGTAVTDQATLAGANASAASGTVTYTWFSDSACTAVASAGSAQPITTPGIIPASAPVTLGAGTYYPVVTYSGDAGNGASSSPCGGEVLQVIASNTPPSCALTAVIAGPPKQLQITVQSSSAGIATIQVTESNNATVAVPSFSSGDTSALVVTATKIDQSQGAQVALSITDVNGLVTNCDPVVPGDPPSTASAGGRVAPAEAAGAQQATPKGCNVGVGAGAANLEGLAGLLLGLGLLRRRRASR